MEETRSLTLTAIIEATVRDIPVYILTKDATFIYDDYFMAWLEYTNLLYRDRIHFGFTLTGHDEMEPFVSHNQVRIMAMRRMYLMGFSTFASIEPVIDWQSAKDVVSNSLRWCQHYKIGLRSGVKKDYYDDALSYSFIEKIVKRIEAEGKTVYLKESTRRLSQRVLQPGAYEAFLSHTVDMDGKPYKKELFQP